MKMFIKFKSLLLLILLALNLGIFSLMLVIRSGGENNISYRKPSNSSSSNSSLLSKRPTIFCMILSTNESINVKGKVVYETWANRCDMVKFVLKLPPKMADSLSSYTDFNYKKNGAIDVNHLLELPNFPGDSGQSYNLTKKVYSSFSYVYSTYPNYDWYLKADQDTFVLVDNLRTFLTDKSADQPVSYGFNFAMHGGYQSGGAGYVLSNEALKRLTARLARDKKSCPNKGTEDLEVGKCLRLCDVALGKSIDEFGRERFHPLSLKTHFTGKYPDWMTRYSQNELKSGIECCSDSSISFHYMSSNEMQKLAKILEDYYSKKSKQSANIPLFQYIVDKYF